MNEGANEMAYAFAAEAGADAAAAGAEAAAAAMKAVEPTVIEPGLVSESVYATFVFEMMP